MKTIFELTRPRSEVLQGELGEDMFAARLKDVMEGSFIQRLKRVQKLAKDPDAAESAELAVFLTAPVSSIRWFAGAMMSRIGDPQVEKAIDGLLERDLSQDVEAEVRKVLESITEVSYKAVEQW